MKQEEFNQLLKKSNLPNEFGMIINELVRTVNDLEERINSLEGELLVLKRKYVYNFREPEVNNENHSRL